MPDGQNIDNRTMPIVDHLFRNEAGKMVAVLSRVFGFRNIGHAEDIVQDTLLIALETWKFGHIPSNPQAWLYRVAKNKAIDLIRRQKLKHKIDSDIAVLLDSEYTLSPVIDEMFGEAAINDSQLRMMFACCHPAVSAEAQITLILNVLCGLSAREIANAFLTGEETISKRLYRTKALLRAKNSRLDYPGDDVIGQRIDSVLKALYLLFSEGYNSSHPHLLIREELCEEALRLAIILTGTPLTSLPKTFALAALMCYQASRLGARLNDHGTIILLRDQDRSQWSGFLIDRGNEFLPRSAARNLHPFCIEAAIASLHANATSYDRTDWNLILQLYDMLLAMTGNPMVALNRSLVLAEMDRLQEAISEMLKLNSLVNNFYYKTSLGDVYLRAGDKAKAAELLQQAIVLPCSAPERELISNKLRQCC